jgi:hypothetical protein
VTWPTAQSQGVPRGSPVFMLPRVTQGNLLVVWGPRGPADLGISARRGRGAWHGPCYRVTPHSSILSGTSNLARINCVRNSKRKGVAGYMKGAWSAMGSDVGNSRAECIGGRPGALSAAQGPGSSHLRVLLRGLVGHWDFACLELGAPGQAF